MKAVILMAGSDEAFADAGYAFPKNLIEINGIPLIQHVVNWVKTLAVQDSDLIFALRRDENQKHYTSDVLKLLAPSSAVVEIESATGGAACTALLAIAHIKPEDELLVINGDIFISNHQLKDVRAHFSRENVDGGIVVFEGVHPRWSYVKCDESGYVIETAEKKPISKLATTGIYYFKRGSDFIESVRKMIIKDASVDGKFFVCPCYNEMVLQHKRIGIYKIEKSDYFSLANPQGVESFGDFLSKAGAAQ